MASAFQHRLVGSIILVAIGIIFLPGLLDGQKITYREDTASIPLRPELAELTEPVDFDSLERAVEDVELLVEPAPTAELTQAAKPKNKLKDKVTTPATSSKKPKLAPLAEPITFAKQPTPAKVPTVSTSWEIRLGTFKNSAAVDDLVIKIRKAGFDAYRLPRYKQPGQLNILYVGPNVNRATLEVVLPRLEKMTGLKGVIQQFDPRDK
ncbi:MAG: DedD protein [Moritella sp.]